MKITLGQLKQLIREEINQEKNLHEGFMGSLGRGVAAVGRAFSPERRVQHDNEINAMAHNIAMDVFRKANKRPGQHPEQFDNLKKDNEVIKMARQMADADQAGEDFEPAAEFIINKADELLQTLGQDTLSEMIKKEVKRQLRNKL